jgi:hypothetical protein
MEKYATVVDPGVDVIARTIAGTKEGERLGT